MCLQCKDRGFYISREYPNCLAMYMGQPHTIKIRSVKIVCDCEYGKLYAKLEGFINEEPRDNHHQS